MKLRIAVNPVLLILLGISTAQDIPPGRLTIAQEVAEGSLVRKVEPVYPQMAQIAHIQGDVVLRAYISKEGLIDDLRAVSGHPILIQSALDAVRQWKYKPYMLNGEPVAVQTTVTVQFRMPTGTQAVPQKIRISSGVAADNRISGKEPVYPLEAKRQHIQGDVVLRAQTDEKGNVVSLQSMSGDPILAEAALAAIKTWKYKPWKLNGEPVPVEFLVTIKFHM